MVFALDGNALAQGAFAFVTALQPWTDIFLGLTIGTGLLYRGLEMVRWSGR